MKLLNSHSRKAGFSFGMTTAVITTLGMMVGLNSSTHSFLAVIGGVLSVAVADAFSDAMGVHIAEESEGVHTPREIWEATLSTLLTKMAIGGSFIIPILLFPLATAIWVSVCFGLFILAAYSVYLAREQKTSPYKSVMEHVGIAILVLIAIHYIGTYIRSVFV